MDYSLSDVLHMGESIKARPHGASFLATLRGTVAEVESSSTSAMLRATSYIV